MCCGGNMDSKRSRNPNLAKREPIVNVDLVDISNGQHLTVDGTTAKMLLAADTFVTKEEYETTRGAGAAPADGQLPPESPATPKETQAPLFSFQPSVDTHLGSRVSEPDPSESQSQGTEDSPPPAE